MHFKEYVESKKTKINESKYPKKIKEIKGYYGVMNIWVVENTLDNHLMLEIDGESSIPLDKVDELIKALKGLKKFK